MTCLLLGRWQGRKSPCRVSPWWQQDVGQEGHVRAPACPACQHPHPSLVLRHPKPEAQEHITWAASSTEMTIFPKVGTMFHPPGLCTIFQEAGLFLLSVSGCLTKLSIFNFNPSSLALLTSSLLSSPPLNFTVSKHHA